MEVCVAKSIKDVSFWSLRGKEAETEDRLADIAECFDL